MQFTLKHLRYFAAAAERSSVTACGPGHPRRRSPRSPRPSPISRTSSTSQLSCAITPRACRRRRPAAAAAGGAQPAGPCRRSQQSARGLADALAGDLDVGCFITFASLLMPGLLGAFAVRVSRTSGVRLHEDHTEALLASLRGRPLRPRPHLRPESRPRPGVRAAGRGAVPRGPAGPPSPRPPPGGVAAANWSTSRSCCSACRRVATTSYRSSTALACSRAWPMRRRPSRWCAAWSPTATATPVMHSRPVSEQALDGMRLVYRPVSEKIRPTQLGLDPPQGRPPAPHGHRLRRRSARNS